MFDWINKHCMSDQDILLLFKNGQREKAFKRLYGLYPRIEKLILSKGGSKADANDVFQAAHYPLPKSQNFKFSSLPLRFTLISIGISVCLVRPSKKPYQTAITRTQCARGSNFSRGH